MHSYNFLSYNDFKEAFSQASSILLDEEKFTALPIIEQIKTLCLLFEDLTAKNTNPSRQEQAYLLGVKLIFSLRKFLFDEDIIFSIGIENPLKELVIREIPMEQVLNNQKNIIINLKQKEVQLANALEKVDNNDSVSLSNDLWQKVLGYANFTWIENSNYTRRKYITSQGKARMIYQKPEADINVWVRYYMRGKKRILMHYYEKADKQYLGYNNGWLYEWFSSYITQHEEDLRQSLYSGSDTPLSGLMSQSNRDNIPGYKGGDYVDALGRQIQAKKGNRRIISFKSIQDAILGGKKSQGILRIITQYEKNLSDPNSKEQLSQNFINQFSTEETLINREYDKIVDNILDKLQIPKDSKKTIIIT